MEEERLRKLEIQENPFTQIVDISDLTELYNEHRLQIHSDLINILLRNNSTIRQLYKVKIIFLLNIYIYYLY